MSETSILLASTGKISREELAMVPTPPATATHRPVSHQVIVEALVETLGFRQIGVIREEYAVSSDGMKMFGVLDHRCCCMTLDQGVKLFASAVRKTYQVSFSKSHSRFGRRLPQECREEADPSAATPSSRAAFSRQCRGRCLSPASWEAGQGPRSGALTIPSHSPDAEHALTSAQPRYLPGRERNLAFRPRNGCA